MSITNALALQYIIEEIDITSQRMIMHKGILYGQALEDAYVQQPSNKMLSQALESLIYTFYYSKNKEAIKQDNKTIPSRKEIDQFSKELSGANTSEEHFDEGWIVEQVNEQGKVRTKKGNSVREIYPGEFLSDSSFHQKPKENDKVKIFVPKEYMDVDSPFYYVFGNTLAESNHDQLVRIYFNCQPQGVMRLIHCVTTIFNRYRIAFNFKCLNHPSYFTRCDPAVLYFDKRYSRILFVLLPAIYKEIKAFLSGDTPLFTKELAPGVAFAENPYKEEHSFGTHCSKMITEGIMQAYGKNLPKQQWFSAIESVIMQEYHYEDLEKLYLNPISKYPYEFPILNAE